MALNETELATLIAETLVDEIQDDPTQRVIKRTVVTQTPKEDGTLEASVSFEYGPPEVTPEMFGALARGIAKAVINHLIANAEVNDTAAGSTWRIS